MSKKYITDNIKIDGQLLDGSGSAGTSGQVLSSTATGTSWVSGSGLPGGPYLPLAGGTLTGNLTLSYAYPRINLYDTNNDSDYSIINNDGSFSIYDITNASHRLTIAADGNVGIGETSVDARLHITTGSAGLINQKFESAGSAAWRVGIPASQTYFAFDNANDNLSAPKVVINASGNVGVGTPSPAYGLTVQNNDTINTEFRNSAGDALAIKINTGLITFLSTYEVTGTNMDIAFTPTKSTGTQTEALRIQASSGRVGIGETNPLEELHITSTNPGVRLQDSDGTDTFGRVHFTGSTLQYYSRDNTSNGIHAWYGSNGTTNTEFMRLKNDGELRLNEYGSGTFTGTATQRLAVDSSGNVIEIPIGSGPVDGSGTANYVTKWSDADTITNSIIYNDGNYVGIGEANPTRALEVKHSTEQGVARFVSGSTSSAFIDIKDANTTANNKVRFGAVGDELSLWAGGGERMRIDSNGNVGIGTDNPGADGLEISRSTNAQLRLTSTGNSSSTLQFADADDVNVGMIQYTHSDNAMAFRTNDGERMRIASNGNVGIGETNPIAALHINKSGVPQMLLDGGGDTTGDIVVPTGEILQIGHWALSTSTYTDRLRIDADGNVGIGNTDPQFKLHVGGQGARMRVGPYYTSGGDRDFVDLIAHDTDSKIYSNNQRFHIQNDSGDIIINPSGYVGIGTTTPSAKLDVNDDVHIDTYAAGTTVAHNAGYIKLLSDGKTGWAPGDELGKIEFYSNDGSGIGPRNAASIRAVNNQGNGSSTTTFEGELAFYTSLHNTAEAEAVRIDSAGNVGIGTASPTYKFEVSNGTQTGTFNPNSSGFMFLGSTSNHPLYFGVNDSTKMVIDSSGNVGINETNPDYKLDVAGTTRITGGLFSYAGVYTDGGTYTNQWQKIFSIPYTSLFYFTGFKLLVTQMGDTGNVNMNAEVHVNYKFQSNNGRINVNIVNFGELPLDAADFEVYRDATNTKLVFYHRVTRNYSKPYYTVLNTDNDTIQWSGSVVGTSLSGEANDGFTEKNIVNSITADADTGYVGIGTTNPTQLLQVEGNSWIKGIYYDTSGDAGTSGQVLSSTSTGTNWITLNDIYYTETEADSRFVNVTGDSMTGVLNMGASDIVFEGGDPGDLVWKNGSGSEIHRIWAGTNTLNYRTNAGTTYGLWHSGNDGSGSGLDADLLDGVQGASYLRSDTADTATGAITFSGQVNLNSTVRLDPNGTNFEIDTDSTDRVIFSFNKNGTRNWSLRAEGGNLNFYRDSGSGSIQINNNRILTTEDEGSGNGLDADTLDGKHATDFTLDYVTDNNNTTTNTINVGRVNLGSTFDSSFLTGDAKISADGYIMTKAIVNTSETGTGPAAIVFGNNSTYGNDQISFVTTGVNRMYIDSNSVDISVNLQVDQDLTVSGGDIVLGGTGRIQGIDTVSANTDAANKLYVDNAIAGVSGGGDVWGDTGSTTGNYLTKWTIPASGHTYEITQSQIYDNGTNIGIGNNVTSTKLNVWNSHYLRSNITNTSQTNILIQGSGYHTGTTLYGNTSIRSTYNNSSNAAGLEFYVASGGTSTGEVMRIASNGDVGINDTNPQVKLSVKDTNGLIAGFYGTGAGTASIRVEQTGSAGGAAIELESASTSYDNYIRSDRSIWITTLNGLGTRFKFEDDGDFHADGDVIAYSTTTSDARLKDDVKPIENAIDKVKAINGVEYTWNAGGRKGQKDLGVIAQNVEEVIPEIVREKKMDLIDGEVYKTVDYDKLTALLIEAVKEQQKQIDELKAQIDGLSK